jgi:hypothetical protein
VPSEIKNTVRSVMVAVWLVWVAERSLRLRTGTNPYNRADYRAFAPCPASTSQNNNTVAGRARTPARPIHRFLNLPESFYVQSI